jgi:small subunit ribosomal protein S20e
MSAPVVKPTKTVEGEENKIHKIRITVTSRKVDALEKFCTELKSKAVGRGLKISGPVRMPTKFLRITTRKSPCGEGTNTFDRFQMRIHKRILDLQCSVEVVQQLTTVQIEPGVDVELTLGGEN